MSFICSSLDDMRGVQKHVPRSPSIHPGERTSTRNANSLPQAQVNRSNCTEDVPVYSHVQECKIRSTFSCSRVVSP